MGDCQLSKVFYLLVCTGRIRIRFIEEECQQFLSLNVPSLFLGPGNKLSCFLSLAIFHSTLHALSAYL